MEEILRQFDPITLDEMSGIRLMNRTDTKFVTTRPMLEQLLKMAQHDYYVQEIDQRHIAAYYPDSYTQPRPIKEIIGDYQGNETDYLLKMITQLHRQPLLLHMIELTRELMRDTVNDDQLYETLEGKNLKGFAASLMQVLSEETDLDEGYMPLPPQENRQTNKIRKLLTNHLKI